MTTPHQPATPSSPGATRAADVLTAGARHLQSQSYVPYGESRHHHHRQASSSFHYQEQQQHQANPSGMILHPSHPSYQQHYTATTSNPQAFSQSSHPTDIKPHMSPASHGLSLPPPPSAATATTSTRGGASFQQHQQQQHYQMPVAPSTSTSASTSQHHRETSSSSKASSNAAKSAATLPPPSSSMTNLASIPSNSLKAPETVVSQTKSDKRSNSNASTSAGLRKGAQTNSHSNTPSLSSASTMTAPAAAESHVNSSTSASASASSSKKKPTRRYNASCDACRARKRKCPGRDPNTGKTLCTACADRGVECTYGNLGEPSRLRRADTENEKLRTAISNALQAESAEEKDEILATITERMLASSAQSHYHNAGKARKSSEIPEDSAHAGQYGSNKRFKEDRDDEDATSMASTPAAAPPAVHPSQILSHARPNFPSQLLLQAENGLNAVNGVPSPRPSSDEETSAQFTQAIISNEQERGQGDSELERHISYYMSMVLPHGDFQDAPAPADDQRLLDFYFSWLNPRYALLSRRFFEQSRHVGDGVYCTPFLLWSLYAHSAVHCPGFEKHQAYFRARAHMLLTKELCKPKAATLPLAQGLILLAGTAAARSDHSLAWTLSFTVTGMVIDLLETMDQSITENERIMRKRLYWSHYVWALVLALALNRKPCVPKLKVELPDIGSNDDLWTAAFPVRSMEEPPAMLAIPRPGYEMECFRETCQLFSFLDEILTNVYVAAHDKRAPETINDAVLSIQERMSAWQSTSLSSNILLDAHALPEVCPPPHIIHFNLLLKAITILLYRPFYNLGSRAKSPIKGARQSCNQCASEIYAIFVYLEQNFGVLQLHFSFIYSAYWAATIDVASAKRDGLNPELLARLRNSSRILLTWISLPGMRQSVSDLIEQIEALLLADVPRQLPPATEAFSAYDPLHQPSMSGSGEIPMQNTTDAYYPQMENMVQQDFIFNDPMMGISPPVDYGPLGGLYWTSATGPLW